MDYSIRAILTARKMTYWESDSENIAERNRVPKYVLAKKYYTWEGFKEAWTDLGKPIDKSYFSYGVTFTDTELVINYCTSRYNAKFVFSPDLIAFLSLEKPFIETPYHEAEYLKGKVGVAYKKPVFDNSAIIFPADMEHDPWVEIAGHGRFNMPKTNYTINQLAKNFTSLMSDSTYGKRVKFTFEYKETDENYRWMIQVETFQAIDFSLQFSLGFLTHLGDMSPDMWTHYSTKAATTSPESVRAGVLQKVKIYYTRIPFNFYPNAVAFCDSLNSTIMELASIWADAKALEQPLFSMEKVAGDNVVGSTITGKCLFKPHPFFKITIHPFLLKMLHLPNTDKEQTGTSIVVMP